MGSWHLMIGDVSITHGDGSKPPPPGDGETVVETPFPARDWLPVTDGDGYAVNPAPREIEVARAAKLAAISDQFDAEVLKGCDSPKGWVDCDDKSQGRIANVIELRERASAAGIVLDPTVGWTMYDNSVVPHDDAELVALGIAIGFGFAAKFARKQALDTATRAASSLSAVDAIVPTSGWPT